MITVKAPHPLKNKLRATTRVLLWATLFYLGVTLIFLGSSFGTSYLLQQNTEQASSGLTVNQVDANKRRKTSYDTSKTASISTSKILQAKRQKAYAIGRLAIPAVNIHNPLFAGYGDQNQNLAYGVVTCLPDRVMGGANNYVLAGHYMGAYGPAVLDNLHLAKRGDRIYVTDLHHIYAYQINRISFAIKPNQVEVENNVKEKSMITLITCSDFNTSKYGYGEHRTVVQGDLISQLKATKKKLQALELTAHPQTTSKQPQVTLPTKKAGRVRSAARPQFFQNTNLISKLIMGFTVIFLLLLCWRIVRIWRPRGKSSSH
ncbi:class A sortase [Lactobacillus xylocopicola]|uniref:Class A sortase n=1 Tax=Lactobacillus xylocopicola TaxID=2976676 RepID=A0ABN6SL93_9LACO|nr:class A sortase [Lactobacillus xylocopicola]BDR61140.1 hypothetical protein KIM322_14010 [Lactobacillus xylocopicola]